MTRRTASEAAREIADALARDGHSHAIGGALALGVAGVSRGTKDVDVNVFVPLERVPDVVETLRGLGIEIEPTSAQAKAKNDGMFIGTWEGMRIDVFVPSIPFSHEAERTAISVTVDGWTGRFLSAEAISIFKLLFFRIKDRSDLERLLAVRGPDLDHAYVRGWLVDMMGEDDERVRTWDDLVSRSRSRHSIES